MTRVKIIPAKNETIEQAEERLYKALNSHRTGDLHTEDFSDPAMKDLIERMQMEHEKTYSNILREIFELLDREYNDSF